MHKSKRRRWPSQKEILILSNWFMRFLDGYRRFMYGRYGVDKLTVAILIVYFILYLSAQFARSYLLLIFSLIVFVLCWVRVFSRNIAQRQKENEVFLRTWNKVKSWMQTLRGRFRDRKTHRYFRCPNCSSTLRVPKGRGKICITCPVCRKEFIKKT